MSEEKIIHTKSNKIGGDIIIIAKEEATPEDIEKTKEIIEQLEANHNDC